MNLPYPLFTHCVVCGDKLEINELLSLRFAFFDCYCGPNNAPGPTVNLQYYKDELRVAVIKINGIKYNLLSEFKTKEELLNKINLLKSFQ